MCNGDSIEARTETAEQTASAPSLEPSAPPAVEGEAPASLVDLVDELSAAMVNTRIYPREHPRVRISLEAVVRNLGELQQHLEEGLLRLLIADDFVVFRGRPLVAISMTATRLVRTLQRWRCGGLEIDGEATVADLEAMFAALEKEPEPDSPPHLLEARLAARGCHRIRFLVQRDVHVRDRATPLLIGRLEVPMRLYQSCIDLLQDITVQVCHGGEIPFGSVRAQVEQVLQRLGDSEGPLMNLARQDQYDAFTFGHSVRVAVLAMNFARALTDDQDFLIKLGTAALLHDCGKSLIPFEILHSRSALDEDQRRQMQRHSSLGAELLLDQDAADDFAVAAAFGHHRSVDGGGYPRTLLAHRNLTVTEIVKLCDVYEALTAARPYKNPMSPTRAYRVMLSMEGHLQPSLLRRFIEVNGIYPTGQLVMLSTGETARVQAQSSELLLPRVRVVRDPSGHELDEKDWRELDLSQLTSNLTVVGPTRDDLPISVAC